VLVVGLLFYSHTFFGPPSVVGGLAYLLIINIVVNGDFDMVGKPVNDSLQPAGSASTVLSPHAPCDSSPHDGSSHSMLTLLPVPVIMGTSESGAGQSIVSS
jgi:hypothetical protein